MLYSALIIDNIRLLKSINLGLSAHLPEPRPIHARHLIIIIKSKRDEVITLGQVLEREIKNMLREIVPEKGAVLGTARSDNSLQRAWPTHRQQPHLHIEVSLDLLPHFQSDRAVHQAIQ